MKVYIAAPWVDREEVETIARKVEALGIEITHRWWFLECLEESDRSASVLRLHGIYDRDGVTRADVVLLLNTKKSEGKAVEQGIAIAQGKIIVAVGVVGEHSKNVFHYLPNYHWVPNLDKAMEVLYRYKYSGWKL